MTRAARRVALRILADRFGGADGFAFGGERGAELELMEHQRVGVARAESILALRGGVVVADSVGLGKTHIALALVERALRRGGRVVVTTPAVLRREWLRPLRRLGTDAVAWLSHERLSRGAYPLERLRGPALVVVDEAHAFRSPGTRRYRALAELCRGAGVVLLTATPVNNSLWDLYFLLRLFASDDAFRDVGVADLREAFRAAAATVARPAPPSLIPVLREVVIRRTRALLRQRVLRLPGARAPLAFPRRAPPVPIRYALDGLGPGIDRILGELEALTLAPLRLERYGAVATASGRGATELVRIGLLKRLESSPAALRASLGRHARYHDAFLRALEQGRLLRPAEHRVLHAPGSGDDGWQLVLGEIALDPLPRGLDRARLQQDAAADLERLHRLVGWLGAGAASSDSARGAGRRAGDRAGSSGRTRRSGRAASADTAENDEAAPGADPKRDRLNRLLDRELRNTKVVIFTEFRDTARSLWRALVGRGRVGLVDGDGAFLGALPSGRRTVIERFAPRANRVRPPPDRERVDVLIATDVLAEGLNLQDADRVISYDLPWNPVRLIQRIGRVDRLGSPHAVVYSYHFLPDRGLERALHLLDRLRAKLAAIGRSVGQESPVLGGGADWGVGEAGSGSGNGSEAGGIGSVFDRLAAGDPDVLDAIERADAAPFEALERLREAYLDAVCGDAGSGTFGRNDASEPVAAPDAEGSLDSIETPGPARVPTACLPAPAGEPLRVLLVHRVADRPVWSVLEWPNGEDTSAAPARPTPVDDPEAVAAEMLMAALRSEPAPLAPDRSVVARALAAVRPRLAERVAALHAPAPLPATAPGARAARRILAALADVPGGPDPALCRRADALLAVLGRRHAAGTEAAIRRAVEAVDGARKRRADRGAGRADAGTRTDAAERAETLVAALEEVLGGGGPRGNGGRGTAAAGEREGGEVEAELVAVLQTRPVRGLTTP